LVLIVDECCAALMMIKDSTRGLLDCSRMMSFVGPVGPAPWRFGLHTDFVRWTWCTCGLVAPGACACLELNEL
jgi:hypothetical protein